MTRYECVFVFDVQAADAVRESILKEATDMISSGGGSILETQPFGIRPIAFELKGRTRGDYRIVRFTAAGDTLQKMDRMLRLKEEVLRFMVTRYVPPKPKKERKKRKPAEVAGTEGEKENGKPEQSVADRQPNATA